MGTSMTEPARAEDHQLVQETLAGNRTSFQLLVERYQDRLFSLARHYTRHSVDAEDIVQEAFLKAYRRLDSFDGRSSFYTWIYRIAVNTVLDVMKRRGRSPVRNVEDPEVVTEARPVACVAPDAGLQTEEISEITHRVLDELPEIFRTVLVLREFEEQSYQSIADTLGISIGTVESRLFRARAKFKQKLLTLYPEFGGA